MTKYIYIYILIQLHWRRILFNNKHKFILKIKVQSFVAREAMVLSLRKSRFESNSIVLYKEVK